MLLLITRNILNEVKISLENGIAQNLPWSVIYPAHQKDLSEEDDLMTKVNFVVVFVGELHKRKFES